VAAELGLAGTVGKRAEKGGTKEEKRRGFVALEGDSRTSLR
jgi:hypothetical protein